MFDTLVESRQQHGTQQHRYTIVSVLAHAGLIAGAAVATGTAVEASPEPDRPAAAIRFVQTPPPRADLPSASTGSSPDAAPSAPQLRPPIGPVLRIPEGLPTITMSLPDPSIDAGPAEGGAPAAGPVLPGAYAGGPVDPSGTYTRKQVEHVAVLRSVTPPRYPAALRAASVEGEVVVRLVVDTVGRVEPGSVEVRRSSDAAFTAAVLDALPKLRFAPASIGGRRVRQLVELPFTFELDR